MIAAAQKTDPDNDERKAADLSLRNWGRYVRDDWLNHHLLIVPPPTSEGYRTPISGYDEPDPVTMPIDHFQGRVSEHVIISIGCEPGGFDAYMVMVHWYTRLIFLEIQQAERLKRLSKHMHCSYDSAQRMLKDAQIRYWDRKKVLDGLLRLCRSSANSACAE